MALDPTPNLGNLKVDADLQRRIERYTHAAGVALEEVVRRAFDEFEAAHNGSHPEVEESAFDALNRAGLIAYLKGSPDSPIDLSTNPEHMEGFGRD